MSTIHFGGMVSGMDTQAIITKILDVSTLRITEAQTSAGEIQKDISAWADISASMTTLTDTLDTLRSYDTWSKMSTASDDPSALSAVANGSAATADYDFAITQLAQAHTVSSTHASVLGVASSSSDLIAGGVLTAGETFTLEGVTFTIGADEYGIAAGGKETISTLRTKINNAAGEMSNKVFASVLDNRLVLARVNTGATKIAMTEPDAGGGTPLQDLGIFSGPGTYTAANVLRQAQDAQFTVNGATITRSANTGLTDVIENVTLNLRGETAGSTVALRVSRDTAAPKAAIQDFIASYNESVRKLEAYSTVQLDGTNKPLTGELQGDTMIPSILYNLRRLATDLKAAYFDDASYTYAGRTGKMDSLDDIGVWTTGKENQLSLVDEDRLDATLGDNFEEVQQLFRGVYETSGGYTHGVAGDLYKYCFNLSTPLTGEIPRHVFQLQKSNTEAQDAITKMLDDLTQEETDLWATFGAMEDAIAAMQSETSFLTNQLGK